MQYEISGTKKEVVMNAKVAVFPAAGLALAAVLITGAPRTNAQESQPGLEEIVVVAPWQVERKVVGRASSGAKIEEISLTRRVDYSDLDLTRYADVQELEQRISDVAKDSCDALAKMFPLDQPDTRTCVNDAVNGAMAREKAVVEAAQESKDGKDVATAPQ